MAIVVSLSLPGVSPARAASGPQGPQPSSTTVPAGPPPLYRAEWSQNATIERPLALVFAPPALVVAREGGPLQAHALDDGRVLWTAAIDVDAPPLAADGLIIAIAGRRLAALDAATGTTRWTTPLSGEADGAATADGIVLVAAGTELHAYRLTDGSWMWGRRLGARALVPAAITGGTAVTAIADGTLGGFDLETGQPLWRSPIDVTPVSLVAGDQRIYFGTAEGYACAYRPPATFDWCHRPRVQPIGDPALGARYVYYAFVDNTLRIFERGSGRTQRILALPARPATGPRLAGTHVVVPVVTGEFAMFETTAFSAVRLPLPQAEIAPSVQVAAASADGTLLGVLTTSPAGQSLVVFARGSGSDPAPSLDPQTQPDIPESPALP